MTNLAKILIGATVVAGVSAIVAVASSDEEKEKTTSFVRSTDEKGMTVITPVYAKENKSVLKRIKEYVAKKIIKFLAFVTLHSDQIEAASTVIGLGSGIIAITGAIRDFKRGNDMAEKIDAINDKLDWLQQHEIESWKATNHNNKVFAAISEEICKSTNVDLTALDKTLSAIA